MNLQISLLIIFLLYFIIIYLFEIQPGDGFWQELQVELFFFSLFQLLFILSC